MRIIAPSVFRRTPESVAPQYFGEVRGCVCVGCGRRSTKPDSLPARKGDQEWHSRRARSRKGPRPIAAAPQNIEAEQALLGAILVNNEAFYRVSDFLEPDHFFEPVHRRIYQVAGELIRANKVATPVTIKTFLPADLAIGDINLAQYVARLAAEATTIINAEDYGRTIYDLALRRALIGIGEDMVNVAYDAPVEKTPRDQIEEAERRLFELAERGNYDSGFHAFETALLTAIDMASAAYKRDGHLSGLATGLDDLDRLMGGLQRRTWSSSPAGRAWARRRSPPTSPSTSPGPGGARSSRTAR